jgi:hypothetical protein
MPQSRVLVADALPARTRSAAVAIGTATVVSTVFVALDRNGGGSTPLEILQGIAALATLKEVVHGVAIASVCAYAFGYASLARRLDVSRPLVLAGLATFLLGCVALVGATILDGFVTPHLALDALGGTPARQAFAYEMVHALGIALTDLARLGWVLQAVGALAWSLVLVRTGGVDRVVGAVGVTSSAAVMALVATSTSRMSMAALLGILVAQMAWNLAAAVWLWPRGTVPGKRGSEVDPVPVRA